MTIQNGASASTGSACLKKAIELFFVVHPKVMKPLLGPFLTAAVCRVLLGVSAQGGQA